MNRVILAACLSACTDGPTYNERALNKQSEVNAGACVPCADPPEWQPMATYCVEPCLHRPGINYTPRSSLLVCCLEGQRCDASRWIEVDGIKGVCIGGLEIGQSADTIYFQACVEPE